MITRSTLGTAKALGSMPRSYLHVRDGDTVIEDLEGSELPDLDAARNEAFSSARKLLAERIKLGEVVGVQRFEIVDEDGTLQAIVPLKDAIRLS